MNTQNVTSWILLSYFAPFATFFFGVFWLGLNIWMFILGTFAVSMMTLFLYLAFKNWQFHVGRLLRELETRELETRKMPKTTVIQEHPLTNLANANLQKPPTHTLALCEEEHLKGLKRSYTTLQEEHDRIVEAYEKERGSLFDECTKQHELLKREKQAQNSQQHALDKAEGRILQLEEEIDNLKFEIKTLLKMDRELLSACVSEEQFLR